MRYWWLLLGFFVVLAVMVNYSTGKEYLQGKQYHYVGISEATDNQTIFLIRNFALDKSINENIYFISSLDDGNISVSYNFYSSKEISYLSKKQFSYFDTPFLSNIPITALMIYFVVLSITIWIFSSSNKKSIVIKSNLMWGIYHPFTYFKKNKPPTTLFAPEVTNTINIKHNKAGIIGVRSFKYLEKDGYLYSAGAGQSCWKTKILEANKIPTDKNSNGCYAFRLVILNEAVYVKHIMAIVSLRGDYCEHADGVIRAQQCEILHLVIDEYYAKYATKLSQYYGVPVSVTDNTIRTYSDWLSSENGVECLKHNTEVMKGSELCQPVKK